MRLEISCEDRRGITQDVLDVLKMYEINLRGIEIGEPGKIFLDFPDLEFAEFQDLMTTLRRVEGISDVLTTPFMPNQRQRNQLSAILQAQPEPVFSIDAKGHIILFNHAVSSSLEMSDEQVRNLNISELIEGFNVLKWLSSKTISTQTTTVTFLHRQYVADFVPIIIPDTDTEVVAGAMVMLKSEQQVIAQPTAPKPVTDCFDGFEAKSTAMKRLLQEAKQMSELDGNILIVGDVGSGKQRLAKACHQNSNYSKGQFVSLDCATLQGDAADAELFGYCDGVLENKKGKEGLLAKANGGSILFDEVSELSFDLQIKLLRVIEYGTYYKLGDTKMQSVDCRIICTSNKDLAESVQNGTFREDLYYRLNVLSLVIPSLRERKADIIPIANRLVHEHAEELGIPAPKLSKPCIEYLEAYPWPGNIRQLSNTLYRAMSLITGGEITKEAIKLPSYGVSVSYIDENFDGTLEEEVKRFERDMLKRLYPSYPSTRQLARKLGLSHTAIANKLREYGISKHSAKL